MVKVVEGKVTVGEEEKVKMGKEQAREKVGKEEVKVGEEEPTQQRVSR